jgi:hypothetical protein
VDTYATVVIVVVLIYWTVGFLYLLLSGPD